MIADAILALFGLYAVIGILFAIVFVMIGIGHVDAAARQSSIPFRILVLPGCAALWPVMASKWFQARRKH